MRRHVRCEDHILKLEEREVVALEFLCEYIEPCAGDLALAQSARERILVDDSASGGVDEVGGRLHEGE